MLPQINVPDHFCSIPWSGIEVNNLGYFRVCCISNNPATHSGLMKDEFGNWMHVLTHDIRDILGSPLLREIRQTHLDGIQHENCNTCWTRDTVAKGKVASQGRRVFFSAKTLRSAVTSPFPSYEEVTANPDMWQGGIQSLDLKLGNLCNLACLHCDPKNSNQLIDEYIAYSGATGITGDVAAPDNNKFIIKPNGRYEVEGTDWFESDKWWDQFTAVAGQLKHVYVTGGEPMVVPFHARMLDYFIEHNLAKNIVMEYDSNLTAINTKLLEKWKSFRKIIIRASIDGIGPVYNLIRYPGNWDRVSKNIIDNKEIISDVTACLMPYNAYQLPEMESWVRSIGSRMALRFVMTPAHLNIVNFPRAVKEELIALYSKYKNRPGQYPETLKALAYIERNIDTVNDEAIDNFIRRSNFQAEYRGNSWKEVCPELAKHFVNHPLYNLNSR